MGRLSVGLMELDQPSSEDRLNEYHWFHAARAPTCCAAPAIEPSAQGAALRALALCQNGAERSLARRLAETES